MPKFILVDQSLASAGGHHLTYNFSLADAARGAGLTPIILASTFASEGLRRTPHIRPTFSSTWYADERAYGMIGTSLESTPAVDLFAAELFEALRDVAAGPGDHVFLHTLGFYETAEILRALVGRDGGTLPILHVLFRRDLEEAARGSPRRREFEFAVGALARNRSRGIDIRFYTDTPQLSRQYFDATGVIFETLPLPFPASLIERLLPSLSQQRAARRQTRICYLGDARDEKGYQYLPGAIAGLPANLRDTAAIRFTLQSNFNVPGGEPGCAAARDALQQLPQGLVDLRMRPLPDAEYYDILCSSDAVAVPYDVACYTHRSSGIFTEALHCETIPIVPAGTSMAAQLPRDFPTVYESPRELARIFERVHHDKQSLRAAVSEMARGWRQIHTPEGIVARLVRKPPVALVATEVDAASLAYDHVRPEAEALPAGTPCVLIQLDLESFHYRVGAARTMTLQVQALRALGYAVYAVCVVNNNLDERCSAQDRPSFWQDVLNDHGKRLELAGAWLSWNGRVKPQGEQDLAAVLAYRRHVTVPRGLQDFVRAAKPAFVLVNYPQNMSTIDKLGLGRLPLVIETHDIQSLHMALYDKSVDVQANLDREVAILQRADAVSCVTEEDASHLRGLGVAQAQSCIPVARAGAIKDDVFAGVQDLAEILAAGVSNATDVDVETAWRLGQTEQIFRLHAVKSMDLLFAGSWHRPNIEGFAWFYETVFKPFLEPRGVTCFVLGGMCIEKHRFQSPGIFWGGTVRDLRVCAAGAKIIIAPLREGTGVNVKVLEAIELAKPVVATGIALRGIPGAQAVLTGFDEPADFADRILELLDSPSARLAASQAIRALGASLLAANDYPAHFRKIAPGPAMPPPAIASVEAAPDALLEYTETHQRTNRFIRILVEAGALQSVFDYHVSRLGDLPIDTTVARFVNALYVARTAPLLEVDGFVGKLQLDRLGAATLPDAMTKIWGYAIERTTLRETAIFDQLIGATNLVEVLARATGQAGAAPWDRLSQRTDIAARGFDLVLWCGPNGCGADAIRWLYETVLRGCDDLSDISILIAGPAPASSRDDARVFIIDTPTDPTILPVVGRALVLSGEGSTSLHPDMLRLALAGEAVGASVLPFDLTAFGAAAPPSLQRDVAAWRRTLTGTAARARAEGRVGASVRRALQTAAPALLAWLDDTSACDLGWSPFMAEVGRVFSDSATRGQVPDPREVVATVGAAGDARRRATIAGFARAGEGRLDPQQATAEPEAAAPADQPPAAPPEAASTHTAPTIRPVVRLASRLKSKIFGS